METALTTTTEGETRALRLIDAPRDLLPAPLAKLREVAELLAASGAMVPAHFQGKPELCMAIAYQAARWGLDAVAVANKAYVANNRISYEAQLIAALVFKSPRLKGHLSISSHGQGAQRYCQVVGRLKAAPKDAKEYVSPTVGQIKTKNSPLWFTDPDQQLSYYSVRAWARRWMPEEIMGIYGPDEFQAETVTVVEEGPKADPFDDDEAPEIEAEMEEAPPPEPSGGPGWEEHARAEQKERAQASQARREERNGQTQQKPQQRKPAPTPSGGDGKAAEPEGMDEARRTVTLAVNRIMEFEIAPPARAAYEALIKRPDWRRIKAYDQGFTNAAKTRIFDHIKAVSTPAGQSQPDPEASDPTPG